MFDSDMMHFLNSASGLEFLTAAVGAALETDVRGLLEQSGPLYAVRQESFPKQV